MPPGLSMAELSFRAIRVVAFESGQWTQHLLPKDHNRPPLCQAVHVDYQRPLFPEAPNLELPAYALVVSFGLVRIAREHGPIEIAPGAHRMTRMDALQAVEAGEIGMQAVPLEIGDVLIRHPWALHRGTPNTTEVPRALASMRYVRRWYADASREVENLPNATWESLTAEQQCLMRFPQSG